MDLSLHAIQYIQIGEFVPKNRPKPVANATQRITTQNQTKLNLAEIPCKYRESFLPESSFILQ